jgi:type I restriction enzyme S subunit
MHEAWPIRPLGDLIELLDSRRRPINSDDRAKRVGNIPYYGANGQQGWIDVPLFDEPLILLAEDGGNFDDFATRPIAYRIDGPSWVNNHAHIVKAAADVNQSFLFWTLVHRDIRRYIAGGTRAKLTQGELRTIEIPSPSLPEQTRIAAILDTLDDTIRQTEHVIAKLQQMKQGLLHDLLTRGIDENGEVRDPERRPELFKDSVLGRIPRGWEVRRLGTLASLQAGFAFSSSVFAAEGVPVIRMSDLRSGSLDVTSAVRVPHSFVRSHADFVLRDGDLVLGMSGSLENRAVVDDRDGPALLNQRVGRFVLNDAKLFLYRMLDLYIGSSFYLRQMRCEAVGAAQLNISSRQVEGTLVPLPPLHEQGLIIERWQSLERHIAVVQSQLVKLRLLKQGVMDDLLTGRIRTPSPIEAAA